MELRIVLRFHLSQLPILLCPFCWDQEKEKEMLRNKNWDLQGVKQVTGVIATDTAGDVVLDIERLKGSSNKCLGMVMSKMWMRQPKRLSLKKCKWKNSVSEQHTPVRR
ncbi:hypothetical protein MUK42_20081 [Musa troglodytarum]|uniref:Uncharacterized protein n=1 Tax=Musa troglodytarum TaxID=320322 RepID=A0A9E7FGG7_9LILI|nr:hypothetical protein MUK42_20081 [Musa troglodytarum]